MSKRDRCSERSTLVVPTSTGLPSFTSRLISITEAFHFPVHHKALSKLQHSRRIPRRDEVPTLTTLVPPLLTRKIKKNIKEHAQVASFLRQWPCIFLFHQHPNIVDVFYESSSQAISYNPHTQLSHQTTPVHINKSDTFWPSSIHEQKWTTVMDPATPQTNKLMSV